jgi:hypothetical protein
MRSGVLTVIAAVAFALPACGNNKSPSTAPTSTAAEGCPESHPLRWRNNVLDGYFHACATPDSTPIVVINTSSTSLRVSAANPNDPSQMREDLFGESSSSKETIVRDAIEGQCVFISGGPCNLPPSGRLFAEGTAPVGIVVGIDPVMTGVATGAAAAEGWVEGRLKPRALAFRQRIENCAKSVKGFVKPGEYVEDAVRNAFEFGSSCPSLFRSRPRVAPACARRRVNNCVAKRWSLHEEPPR